MTAPTGAEREASCDLLGSLRPRISWTSRRLRFYASDAGGRLLRQALLRAIDDLEAIELERYPTLLLMRQSYGLRANVSAYDATYVALAEALDCELLTCDRRLAGAPGPRCVIRLLQ